MTAKRITVNPVVAKEDVMRGRKYINIKMFGALVLGLGLPGAGEARAEVGVSVHFGAPGVVVSAGAGPSVHHLPAVANYQNDMGMFQVAGVWWTLRGGELFRVVARPGFWGLVAPPAWPSVQLQLIRDYGWSCYMGESIPYQVFARDWRGYHRNRFAAFRTRGQGRNWQHVVSQRRQAWQRQETARPHASARTTPRSVRSGAGGGNQGHASGRVEERGRSQGNGNGQDRGQGHGQGRTEGRSSSRGQGHRS